MAELNAQNCSTSLLGTGLTDCLADLGYPKGFILTQKSWREDVTTVIDKDYVVAKVQEGVFFPFINSTGFEQNTPETTTEEFQDGTLVAVRNGKPQFTFQYVNTWQFQKIAYSYNSYKAFNVILVFDNDRMLLASNGESIYGFTAGMIDTNTYMFNTGSETGKTPMSFQLLDNKQFNSQGEILHPEFDITEELNGVLDCLLTEGSAVTGGDVTIKVTAKVNPAVSILGLAIEQFSLVIDGVREAVTAVSYDDVTGTYALTPTSTTTGGESVVVELYDSTVPANVAKLGDLLFKGKSDVITVA